jgi:hypothetical protein
MPPDLGGDAALAAAVEVERVSRWPSAPTEAGELLVELGYEDEAGLRDGALGE